MGGDIKVDFLKEVDFVWPKGRLCRLKEGVKETGGQSR